MHGRSQHYVKRKSKYFKNTIIIPYNLNVRESDNTVIKHGIIYIEKDMADIPDKHKCARRKRCILNGRRFFVEYKEMTNLKTKCCSTENEITLYNEGKPLILKGQEQSANSHLSCLIKPLGQINKIISSKTAIDFHNVNRLQNSRNTSEEHLSSHHQFYVAENGSYHINIRNQENRRVDLVQPFLVQHKPLKRLKNNCCAPAFNGLEKVVSHINLLNIKEVQLMGSRKDFNIVESHFDSLNTFQDLTSCTKEIPMTSAPFHEKLGEGNSSDKNSTTDINQNKFYTMSKFRCKPKDSFDRCKVYVERLDAKICFMDCLGLKLTVKTDIKKIREVALMRAYKIRKCQVQLTRAVIPTRSKCNKASSKL